MYNKDLFLPTMSQYASGQFFKDFDQKFKAELKGGQNAKDAIGGRLPMKKNEEWVAALRNIIPGIDVPSPNQIRSAQSVEELILWRIFMESFTRD